jgi:hypothetical protein
MLKRILGVALCLSLSGCLANEKYYDAVTQQNLTTQLVSAKEEKKSEIRRHDHQEKMATILATALSAASKSSDKTDDVLVPIVFMTLEDKWSVSEMLADSRKAPTQLQKIEAPEKTSDIIKATGSTLLGLGGIYLGVKQADGMVDIAEAGIKAAGVTITGDKNIVDSQKSNTDNVVQGDNNTLTGGNPSNETEVDKSTQTEEASDTECGEMPDSCPDAICSEGTWKINESNTEYGGLSCDTYIDTYL